MSTSLLSEDQATRRPKRVVASKVTQSSDWLRTSPVAFSKAFRQALDLPSAKTSKSAWAAFDAINLQHALPRSSFHSGTLAHDGPSDSCTRLLPLPIAGGDKCLSVRGKRLARPDRHLPRTWVPEVDQGGGRY